MKYLECVPSVETRIATFKALVGKPISGRSSGVDPLILTDKIGVDDLLRKVKNIGNQLKGYTEKLVFSFADITAYKRVKANMEHNNINYREFTVADMIQFASGLQ